MGKNLKAVLKILLVLTLIINLVGQPLLQVFAEDGEVISDKYSYIVKYLDETGKSIKTEEKVENVNKDQEVKVSELKEEIEGYEFKLAKLKDEEITGDVITISEDNLEISLIYSEKVEDKYSYTVEYLNEEGKTLKDKEEFKNLDKDTTINLKALSQVKVEDYSFKELRVNDKKQETLSEEYKLEEDLSIKVIYTPDATGQVSYTVSHLYGSKKIVADEIVTVEKGTEIDLKTLKRNFDGYEFKNVKIDGKEMDLEKKYKIEKTEFIDVYYDTQDVSKEYTINLINKYDSKKMDTVKVNGTVGERVNLKNLFKSKGKEIKNIDNFVFDEEIIYLGEKTEVSAKIAIKTKYEITFVQKDKKETKIELNGFVSQSIVLPNEIGDFKGNVNTIFLREDNSALNVKFESDKDNSVVPIVKTININYIDKNDVVLVEKDTVKTLEGLKFNVIPKEIVGYTLPANEVVDATKDIDFKYDKENLKYTLRVVDRDGLGIVDRKGKFIENTTTGKVGDKYTLELTKEQREDLIEYNYDTSVILGKSSFIAVEAIRKGSTGGGGGGSTSNRYVGYKIIHEDRDGKELDLEKGTARVGSEITGERNKYTHYTFFSVSPRNEKIEIVEDESKNIIRYVYRSDRDDDSNSSSSGSSSSRRRSSSSSLPQLNKYDHLQYIYGYEDGTIRPESKVTREEAAMMMFRLLDTDMSPYRNTAVKEYPDVSKDRWSYEAIRTLSELEILTGYDDGTFRPTKPMSRAEVVTMISKFEGITKNNVNKFTDTSSHWSTVYINSAEANGWINGYEDGTFRPNNSVSRAEFVNMVNKVLDRRVEADGVLPGVKTFKDLNQNKWYYYPIVEATNGHDYTRYPNGREKWSKLK